MPVALLSLAMRGSYVVPLRDLSMEDLPLAGGKNASLGELHRALRGTGGRVPEGFVLTTDAYRSHLRENGIEREIAERAARLDPGDVRALARQAAAIRKRIASCPLPEKVSREARRAYARMASGRGDPDVAVRSSATAEDLPGASFAGQQETFLHVRGWPRVERAIRLCMASLYTDRAVAYRAERKIAQGRVSISVCVQRMVRSGAASSGVIFTLDTESGCRNVILVQSAFGLGEAIVQGEVNPDELWIHKEALRKGKRPILKRTLGSKAVRLVDGGARGGVRRLPVPPAQRRRFSLADDEALALSRWALAIEGHYSRRAGRDAPMDIEWAKDGVDGRLYILQARPETVHSRSDPFTFEVFRRTGKGKVLATGQSVGTRIGKGRTRRIEEAKDLPRFRQGEVLVSPMTDPDWEPVLRKASAIVTDQGGRTCHAAIVSRELGIPCVVGTGDGTRVLRSGRLVTVSCAEGDEGKVYEGDVAFSRRRVDTRTIPDPAVPVHLILANPDAAFRLGRLPAAGVGLLRLEFLIGRRIGIHPMALAHPEQVADRAVLREIRARAEGYPDPAELFVDRLAQGVAQIAAAFFPRPVVVRFSDFKTDEYADLLGGRFFEPVEANPMIGWRGASRYYDPRYRDGFALECRAIRRVREEMGLSNVKVMIPFCRTLSEGRRVLSEMRRNGLARGRKGLEVLVMCEVPSNVVLAEAFADLFDGFSIGSNDLTQLTLGVDRGSERLARLFDERDPGVRRMIRDVIERARRKGRPVGFCGQAPSDRPEFARFLVDCAISSISVNPDAFLRVAATIPARAAARS